MRFRSMRPTGCSHESVISCGTSPPRLMSTVAAPRSKSKTCGSVRRIALPDDLRDELIAHRLRSPFSKQADPMFASATGTPLLHRNIARRGFEAARDEAGLPEHLTFHDLRHAAASRLIAAGLSAVTVASLLGHDNPTTTLTVYAHLFDRAKTDDQVRQVLRMAGA